MSDPRILPHERLPSGWGDAFAAMPTEAPDADAWPRIARAAWSQPRRPAWPVWLAAAAVLAVVVVLPWRLTMEPETRSAAPVAARTVPAPAAMKRAANADTAQAGARIAASSPPGSSAATDAESPASSASSSSNDGMPKAQQRIATAAERNTAVVAQDTTSATTQVDDAPADATNASPRLATDADVDTVTPADASAFGSELEQLYAESAQLEALVAMARSDRVATTGTAAALASQYDAQVADIDGRLIQPDVTPEERTRLWRARVAALRELAGFESTQRLLAAHGERYDAMLVSID